MPRRPAIVTQADIARAARVAQALGPAWRVEIAPDGVIRLIQGEPEPSTELEEPEDSFALAAKFVP